MYSIEIEKRCLRDLKQLDKKTIHKAFDLIKSVIAKDPFIGKELRGKYKGLFGYRFSDYRIIYEIRKAALIIVVLRIRHRQNVYDGL